ncbi:MAG: cobyrinate a,c-diamide synthase [Dehalococcoidia bacterium]
MNSAGTGCRGVLISAPQGRSGKTIASLALCASFKKKGWVVQPFKKGPDYIDPSWLSEAAGRNCRNLDTFLMPEETVTGSFYRSCQGADLAVVEGAMGLYDAPDSTGWGSTAHLARLLSLPVILVVDCTRMTGSVAAMVSGYQHFQPEITIGGVIFNNVAGNRHHQKLASAVGEHCKIPVVGSIPRSKNLSMTQRHLGHIPFVEKDGAGYIIDRIVNNIEPHLDLDAIMSVADTFEPDEAVSHGIASGGQSKDVARIGVFRDKAFNFYYPENLEALSQAGGKLVYIDSVNDRLPEIDGLYIGGGFPEFFLEELEGNKLLRNDIAMAVEGGLPVYAECAGLMYLSRSITWKGRSHQMAGALSIDVELLERPQGHGYVEAEISEDNDFYPLGTMIKGHEFHHSKISGKEKLNFACKIKRGHGMGNGSDAIIYKNVFATYTHIHALGNPCWADAFVSLAVRQCGSQRMFSLSSS